MNNRITLSTALVRHLLRTLPGVEGGRVLLDLGVIGVASLRLDRLEIGQDVLQIPLSFQPRGSTNSDGMTANLCLADWRVEQDLLWFTIDRIGALRGGLFQAARGALLKLISGMIQRRLGDQVIIQQQGGQLGIPLNTLLYEWGDVRLPVRISALELRDGVILHVEAGDA